MCQTQLLAVAVEVGLDQVGREGIVSGGDRGMSRECQLVRHLQRRLVEAACGARGEALAGKLERQERGMALVHVHHVCLSIGRQNGAERAQTANAENDLLTNARVLVAAVEVAGDPAIVLTVLGQIRIQQVQRHATHSGDPHAGVYGAARKRHVDHNWRALRVEHRAHRHGVRIETIVGLALVARVVDHLAEVAVPIHQPDGDERQTKVAGGLEVVAGQHAEAARVDRQRLGNREFGAEVGDARDVLHLRRVVEVLLQITVTLEDAHSWQT